MPAPRVSLRPAPCPLPQLRAELRAAELERDTYRKQLQEALASAAEPSAAARAEREAAALRQQLRELQEDQAKLQAELQAFEERGKQKEAVERQNARCAGAGPTGDAAEHSRPRAPRVLALDRLLLLSRVPRWAQPRTRVAALPPALTLLSTPPVPSAPILASLPGLRS